MPITSNWYNEEKSILYVQYEGNWSLEDHYKAIDTNSSMIGSVSHPVVAICDFSKSGPIPPQFLTSGRHSEHITPENASQVILFGINRYMEIIAKMFQKMFPKSTRGLFVASSLSESIAQAFKTLNETVKNV